MEKVKVILADDQEIFNTIRADFLKKIDYVEILGLAKDGQEEYDMIKELKPDIVITDNQMPYMNGIDVIEKVKNDNEIIDKPCFIIVSADGLYEYRTRIEEYNILDIVNKSIGIEGINNRIKECINNLV
ncbi:MAG: response regulator [Clostridia bacterium]|nr:response regulator [Clostridia bacterium]